MATSINPDQNSQSTLRLENTEKRDSLRVIEEKYQREWADHRLFEKDAPALDQRPASASPDELESEESKFFGTMAYPYVNGVPHLGHAFTITKVEFAARVSRAQGKRVLYPQGYHCTGMPIQACADKLANEIASYGKDLRLFKEEDMITTSAAKDIGADVTKFTNTKRGKAALKSGQYKYQFQVMLAIGVPREEIYKFTDPQYWLEYFPPIWQRDISNLGCSIDWRRSFVTTDANPFYDSFVQWQMRCLKDMNRIRYGSRYTVYSPKDQQPCLDHDRSSGEGVLVQEYTAVKCQVIKWSQSAANHMEDKIPAGSNVFFILATLRPETMYGQTNLFVSPKMTYGVFKASTLDFYLASDRSARNMAFQSIFEWGEVPKVAEISGSDVVGTLVNAPLSYCQEIYVLPMDTIKDSKGTGVVTSVPSDSPDDYAMLVELAKKPGYYKIRPEWVSIDNILPIIETKDYGNLIAPSLVKSLKVNSPKDSKLVEAKDIAYKQGFYQGIMVYGDYAGQSVQDAKPKVRQDLIGSGIAFAYSEPDGPVISRSGDECVAALLPQWFLAYGDGDCDWRDEIRNFVNSTDFTAYNTETFNAIQKTLEWMNQWAVTRQFGLGTKLPWDPMQIVESLSDSTIYMAYYTVAQYLHRDIYGREQGKGNINVDQMTDNVWDYIFDRTDEVYSDIPKATLDAMRREFQYWYPLDVRVSGKDLINNHLIFMLYIHQAIWGGRGSKYLPRSIRMNGHAMLNGEKMAKSTGNFLTLHDAVQKFGADAIRVALADAGDSTEDANIEENVANAVILKLFELKQWAEEVILHSRILKEGETFAQVKEQMGSLRDASVIQRTGPTGFWDNIFENELNVLANEAIDNYNYTLYKAALKSAFYDLMAARDSYRMATGTAGIGMHQTLVQRYVDLQARLIAPIAPHWAEYIWREVLKKETYISVETFPIIPDPVLSLSSINHYVRSTASAISSLDGSSVKKLDKGKTTSYDPKADKKLTVYVAKSWPAWQDKYINLVREMSDGMSLNLNAVSQRVDKPDAKKAMPFILNLKKKLEAEGPQGALERRLAFNETAVLAEMVPGLIGTIPKLKEVAIVMVEDDGKGMLAEGLAVSNLPTVASSAEPGSPSFLFENL